MGRFKKSCSNVLHSTWCQNSENVSVKVPVYKYLQAFKKLATEAGFKPHKVHYVCDLCIERAEQSKEFRRFLSPAIRQCDSREEVTYLQSNILISAMQAGLSSRNNCKFLIFHV